VLGMRRGQVSPADKLLEETSPEARSGGKSLLPLFVELLSSFINDLNTYTRFLQNLQFCSGSGKRKILTVGIYFED